MKNSLELKCRFLFPPRNSEDTRIMKYTEFLEIEVYDDPGSPEIFYAVAIDPKSVRCCPEFIQFIDDCKDYETVSGQIGTIFRYSHEEACNLLFFVISDRQFLIDRDGYIHLGTLSQFVSEEELRFIESALTDYYGFKIYEKERPGI